MSSETKPYRNKRTGVFRIVGADGKATEIRVFSRQNHFFTRAILHQARRYMILEAFHDFAVNFIGCCFEAQNRPPSDRIQPTNNRHGVADDVVKK